MDGGDSAGGSAELARLIDEHGECILSDLKSHYGVELRDVLVPGSGLSSRMVLAYIRNLPIGCATVAALQGDKSHTGWDPTMYMLANIFDALQQNTYVAVAANSKRKPSPPKPIERPAANKQKKSSGPNNFAVMAQIAHTAGKKRKKA